MEVIADYSGSIFHPKRRMEEIKVATEHLQGVDFDAIAVRGVSGLTRGSIIAHLMCKGLIVVRKRESRHSCMDVEGAVIRRGGHWIIVDDFVMSGSTVAAILEAVIQKDFGATVDNCLGVYCTNWGHLRDLGHLSAIHNHISVALTKLEVTHGGRW